MQISDQSLLEIVKVWNKIILTNVFPIGGNTDRLAALQAYLLYCLAQAIKVNIGYIVAKIMDGIVITNRKLPYGLLLNRLFDHLSLPSCPTESPGAGINRTTIRRKDIAKKLNGESKGNVGESSEPQAYVNANVDVDDELAIVPCEEDPNIRHHGIGAMNFGLVSIGSSARWEPYGKILRNYGKKFAINRT